MISKARAAANLTGVAWNTRGDVLEQADDNSQRVTPPTDGQIQAHIAADPLAYLDRRREDPETPSIQLQMEAFWEGGQARIDMQAKIDAISAKHPKPS